MRSCDGRFWLESIPELSCSLNIIPRAGMSPNEQLNTLSRLLLVIFVVLYVFKFEGSYFFLIISLVVVFLMYYIQQRAIDLMTAEHYTTKNVTPKTGPVPPGPYPRGRTEVHNTPCTTGKDIIFESPTASRFCNDSERLRFNDPEYISPNQRLVGPPNPKTLNEPVVIPPPADLSYWKANNLVHHSAVNKDSQRDVYRSGYQVSTCCGDVSNKYLSPAPKPCGPNPALRCTPKTVPPPRNPVYAPGQTVGGKAVDSHVVEGFQFPYLRENEPGFVNTSCGYNPKQLQTSALPPNLPAGNCQQNPAFKQYHKNMFTQTLQPGVYTTNQVNEPINSNIGISFTQQFPPLSCQNTPDGGVLYTENDPRLMPEVIEPVDDSVVNPVDQSNIFDPRHTGYGTSYRAYTDDTLGQTRFYYDDIDAVKMPNYITRSNIDFTPFADSYGPLKCGEECGNKYNSDIRALANDQFLRSTIQQRTDLQERLMRKANIRSTQQRQAPIRTTKYYMSGGRCV